MESQLNSEFEVDTKQDQNQAALLTLGYNT